MKLRLASLPQFVLGVLMGGLPLVAPVAVWAQAAKEKDPDALVNAAAKDDKSAGAFRSGKLPGDLSDLLDADGDGMVSDAEAAKAVGGFQKAAGAKNEQGQEIRNALDKNGDGKVDAMEAQAGVAQGRREFRQGKGEAGGGSANLLERFDVDGNGKITAGEVRESAQKMGPFGQFILPRMAQMFNQMDQNKDGTIDEIEVELMADYFAQQTATREQQRQEQRNAQLWQMAQQTLVAQDKNRDQRITEREAVGDLAAKFAQVDIDLNGKITVAEIYDYLKANAPQQEERGREGREGRFGPGGPNGQGGPPFGKPRGDFPKGGFKPGNN